MAKKNQSKRLTNQHKKSKGVVGIFGDEEKLHDVTVGKLVGVKNNQDLMATGNAIGSDLFHQLSKLG